MIHVKIIAVGSIREDYLTSAAAEYIKRLGAYCRPEICELREAKLPENPTQGQITAALSAEAKDILAEIPTRAYTVALCVEGGQLSSEQLAARIELETQTHPSLCFIIGSSYGLAPEVKATADLRLSLSKLTFPHKLFRVMLLESIYRSFTIIKGTKYHK